jgi:nitroreductase
MNCAIAMRNIEMLALTMGLGTCWNGLLVVAAAKKEGVINGLLSLDDSRMVWGSLMIGYPRYRSRFKLPRR